MGECHMDEFALIDLLSQYDEITERIAGKSRKEVLEWMEKFGDVTKLDNPYDDSLYSFRSSSGILTNFRFDESDTLIILHRQ